MASLEEKLSRFPYRIILGSASPRRQELLKSLGFKYELQPINAVEEWPKDLQAEQIPIFLAELKAKAYSKTLAADEILITADTVVWCGERVFNKPADFDEGKKMLQELSGRMHEVFTAVSLRSAKKLHTFYDRSKVFFKNLSEEEIEYYLHHYSPYDKAGGYGVQDWIGYIAINRIEGSFYNVMGLPVQKLYEELVRF